MARKFELIRGPLDGARIVVPPGNFTLFVPWGQRVHVYEMRMELRPKKKPRPVMLHAGIWHKGG